jgi:hypothetical protein
MSYRKCVHRSPIKYLYINIILILFLAILAGADFIECDLQFTKDKGKNY